MKITTFFLSICLVLLPLSAFSQQMIGLPTIGHVSATTAKILVIAQNSTELLLSYQTDTALIQKTYTASLHDTINGKIIDYYKLEINDLSPNSSYNFVFSFQKNSPSANTTTLKTTPPAHQVYDFNFQIGSCLAPFHGIFLPLRPRLKILKTMNTLPADFMIWMGDNVYFLNGEWNEYDKMIEKMVRYRKNKYLRQFLNHQPNYATWDDHDFGPNNGQSSFGNKTTTLSIFNKFWENPSAGTDSTKGVFFTFSHSDAQFFVLDARYHRTKGKTALGTAQLAWLKTELKKSKATFKFIVSSTQVLPHTFVEDLGDYPVEKKSLLDFLAQEKINGVIFLSGDIHYTELNKQERVGNYPLLEITSSALSSPAFPGAKKNNPNRMPHTFSRQKNFGYFQISGKTGERKCHIFIKNRKQKTLWSYIVHEKDLKL